jgi:two-component sensor histidine kinase
MRGRATGTTGRSLRARLILVLGLALTPPVAAGIGAAYSAYTNETESARRSLVQTAKVVTDEHRNLIAGAGQVLAALATQEDVSRAVMPACQLALQRALYRLPDYLLIVVVDAAGKIRCTDQAEAPGSSVVSEEWFATVQQGREFVVSNLLVDPQTGLRSLVAAVPLFHDGAVAGAIAMNIDLTSLVRLSQGLGLPRDSFVAVADAKGQLLPLAGSEVPTFPAPWWADLVRATATNQAPAENRDAQGRRYIVASAPLRPGSLAAVLGQPASSLFAWLHLKLATDLAIPLLLWIAALVAAWIAADRLVLRWVQRLRELASAFATGSRVEPPIKFERAPDELRELEAAMTGMMRMIQNSNAELKAALANRELLIREIHHRVKNNLQIISSLVNLQARNLPEGPARQFATDMRSRIAALTLVHRNLYETDDLQHVELSSFLTALCAQLAEFGSAERRGIAVVTEIDSAMVQAENAATLAMLMTEAVTNALKHAFRPGQGGRVVVQLRVAADGPVTLSVADDGNATPPAPAGERERGLGRELMQGYVRQLGGKMTVTKAGGTRVEVVIPKLL